MKPGPRLCVVGSSNIDLTIRTARLPRAGETLTGRAMYLGFGGKGANQAVMAAGLGAQVTMVTRVGTDAFGRSTLDNFRRHGVNTDHVHLDEVDSSGMAAIVVDDQAQNCIIIVPGANQGLSAADVQHAESAIREARSVLCQLETPLAATLAAFRLGRAAGVRTILNPAPAMALPDELLALTDLCVPNEPEIEMLTGQPAATLEQARQAAQALLARGPRAVIVTLGQRGALVVDRQTVAPIPAMKVTAVDTTGAGDAFIGSLAVFLAEDQPLFQAARLASVAAALSVTRPGTQAAFPSRMEVEGFQEPAED